MLDTTMLIDYSVSVEPAYSHLRTMLSKRAEVGVTAIQIGEFMSGIAPSDRAFWLTFLRSLTIWPISWEAAVNAGIYRYEFSRRGIQLSMTDTIIAAVAKERDAIVVTANVKHFPMSDIEVMTIRP